MAHPILFEINTRCWLRALSEKNRVPVTLANVPEQEFASWAGWGFTYIWLMGVWTTGPLARAQALGDPRQRQAYAAALSDWTEADVAGSPYAIADYQVPQHLGGEAGLEKFRHKLASFDLKLVLDFVPNHLGLDHPWVVQHPERFVQSPSAAPEFFRQETSAGPCFIAHGKDPYFSAWTDTAQLDYRRTDTQLAMRELLQGVARRCDGVRCDMAMLLLKDIFAKTWARFPTSGSESLTEFWAEAIQAAKEKSPDFLFLAEAYWGTEPRLRSLGFDVTYDKELYDNLVSRNAPGVRTHLSQLSPQDLACGAHFLENHDEPRIASLLPPLEQRPAALVMLGLPGMRFLHEGQITGAVRRVPVQLARRAAEAVQPEIEHIYNQILAALQASLVGKGACQLLQPREAWTGNPTAQDFVIIQWCAAEPAFDLVVVNLAPHHSQCYATLPLPQVSVNKWLMRDILGTQSFERPSTELRSQGLYLDLPPHGAQLFHFEPV